MNKVSLMNVVLNCVTHEYIILVLRQNQSMCTKLKTGGFR